MVIDMSKDSEPNLDFDDDLQQDAEVFGLAKAQGVFAAPDVAVDPPPVQHSDNDSIVHQPYGGVPEQLVEVLYLSREVYGETNSRYAQRFCQWVSDVLERPMREIELQETIELHRLLGVSKTNFGAAGHYSHSQGRRQHSKRKLVRKMAIQCAVNTLRAVLNWYKGLEWRSWCDRALYRATLTEKDLKHKY